MPRERKRHGYAERLKYIRMLKHGYSVNYIHHRYDIGDSLLRTLWASYQKDVRKALAKRRYARPSAEERFRAIEDFEIKHLSLVEVLLKYGIREGTPNHWRSLQVHVRRMQAEEVYGQTKERERQLPWRRQKPSKS